MEILHGISVSGSRRKREELLTQQGALDSGLSPAETDKFSLFPGFYSLFEIFGGFRMVLLLGLETEKENTAIEVHLSSINMGIYLRS